MINRAIFLNCFFIIAAPSFLQGSDIPSDVLIIPQKKYVNLKKQEIIKKIEFYAYRDLSLDLRLNDDLAVLARLIKQSRESLQAQLLQELTHYTIEDTKKYNRRNRLDTEKIFHLIRALYCISHNEDDIAMTKKFSAKIVTATHADKHQKLFTKKEDACSEKEIALKEQLNRVTDTTTAFLRDNNDDNDYFNSLLNDNDRNGKYFYHNAVMEKNFYRIQINELLENSATQIGYSVGTKLMNKAIPLQDPEAEKALSCAFVNQARINTLNAEYILTDYVSLLHSRINHVA